MISLRARDMRELSERGARRSGSPTRARSSSTCASSRRPARSRTRRGCKLAKREIARILTVQHERQRRGRDGRRQTKRPDETASRGGTRPPSHRRAEAVPARRAEATAGGEAAEAGDAGRRSRPPTSAGRRRADAPRRPAGGDSGRRGADRPPTRLPPPPQPSRSRARAAHVCRAPLRHKHSKPKREPPATRKPIVRGAEAGDRARPPPGAARRRRLRQGRQDDRRQGRA